MSWNEYVAALRAIPEAERRAEIDAIKGTLEHNRNYCSDPRQRALTRERLTNKIRAIEESLT